MHLFFANKIVKIEVLDRNGVVAVTAEKGFTFPKNIESSEDSILIIKGVQLREFEHDERVFVVTTTKAGDRIKYSGLVAVSVSNQLNVKIIKNNATEVLEERRRYFKIKVEEKGRALFMVRDEETVRFDEPYPIEVLDINIGGIFMKCDGFEFMQDDCVCVDIDLFVDYKLNAMARVLRVQRTPEGEIKGYGCEFQGITPAQEDYIGKFIYKIQFAQRQKDMAKDMDY